MTTATHRFFNTLNYTVLTSARLGVPNDLSLLAHTAGSAIGAGRVRHFGDRVSFSMKHVTPSGAQRNNLWVTDGSSKGALYVSSSDVLDVGSLRYADSHVGWLQGEYATGGKFERKNVELWASVYSKDAAGISPYKVGEIAEYNTVNTVLFTADGGGGKYALGHSDSKGWTEVWIWDLAKKSKQVIHAPDGTVFSSIKGVTKEYVWVLVYDQHGLDVENVYLARYQLTAN